MIGFMTINRLLFKLRKKATFDTRNYKFNAYIQLIECGYLIILMTSILNMEVLNFENALEGV